jgi:hypothetical protein
VWREETRLYWTRSGKIGWRVYPGAVFQDAQGVLETLVLRALSSLIHNESRLQYLSGFILPTNPLLAPTTIIEQYKILGPRGGMPLAF